MLMISLEWWLFLYKYWASETIMLPASDMLERYVKWLLLRKEKLISSCSFKHSTPSWLAWCHSQMKRRRSSVSHTRLRSSSTFCLSFLLAWVSLSLSLPLHLFLFLLFSITPTEKAALLAPLISLLNLLCDGGKTSYGLNFLTVSLSLTDGPPKANAGGSEYPSAHLSPNTKQTETQPPHLSAQVSGNCLLGKDNEKHRQ